ncbi:MAG: hypothetical protein AB7F35_29640 [Acetobacteraceae bacterium]
MTFVTIMMAACNIIRTDSESNRNALIRPRTHKGDFLAGPPLPCPPLKPGGFGRTAAHGAAQPGYEVAHRLLPVGIGQELRDPQLPPLATFQAGYRQKEVRVAAERGGEDGVTGRAVAEVVAHAAMLAPWTQTEQNCINDGTYGGKEI